MPFRPQQGRAFVEDRWLGSRQGYKKREPNLRLSIQLIRSQMTFKSLRSHMGLRIRFPWDSEVRSAYGAQPAARPHSDLSARRVNAVSRISRQIFANLDHVKLRHLDHPGLESRPSSERRPRAGLRGWKLCEIHLFLNSALNPGGLRSGKPLVIRTGLSDKLFRLCNRTWAA